ncbi:MAG: amidase, partial [Desulfobacula sp.]|nr:amidase [Desulfobacula sp.]
MEQTAILLVDLQGDFTQMKSGSLAVEGTDKKYLDTIIENLNYLKDKGFKIFATQDWHPRDHVSFFTNNKGTQPYDIIEIDGLDQVMWPPHCVQNTKNADILVKTDMFTSIIKKGRNSKFDSYSGFQDDGGTKTDLKEIL